MACVWCRAGPGVPRLKRQVRGCAAAVLSCFNTSAVAGARLDEGQHCEQDVRISDSVCTPLTAAWQRILLSLLGKTVGTRVVFMGEHEGQPAAPRLC